MTDQELDNLFRRNFNKMMRGVQLGMTTYEEFKEDYPTLYSVIIHSLKEVDNGKTKVKKEELDL